MQRREHDPKALGAEPDRRVKGVTAKEYDIRVQGITRRYLVIQPDNIEPATVPTVIDLHGSGSSAEEHVSITDARSFAALGAVFVVPRAAIPFRLLADWPAGWAWNVPGSPLPGESAARREPDDMAFLDALTTRLIDGHGVDPCRIHLRGFSGGARLSSHVLAASGDRMASVCCVGGVRFVAPSGDLCPLLAIHGYLDEINPPDGGDGPRWSESVASAVYRWAIVSRCGPTPQHHTIGDGVRATCYYDGDDVAAVRLITIADAAHSWPGTSQRDHIAQFGASGSFSASQAHWEFICEIDNGRQAAP
jgi:polyhydroxybutyrate depolymerase